MTFTRFGHASSWLLGCARGRIILWWLERAAFAVGVLVTGWILYGVEHHFFPVIRDWQMTYIHKVDGRYVLGGSLVKSRACELISTSIMAVPKVPLAPRQLVYQIKPAEILGGNAPTGFTTWGPWEMAIPKPLLQQRDQISFLEIVGHHRCHAMWTQETVYGTVPIERLP
jgi:hypothetical protein